MSDGDRMITSPSESEVETPLENPSSSILSPPDSQHRERTMPTSASGSSIANSNGKRPIQTISNGNDDVEELAAMANGKARQEMPTKTHAASGYTWIRAEDEPGYSWRNKNALDEATRAWDSMQHRDRMVKNKYGDPFEAYEKEQAIAASLK
ncbi:Hypothetical predicted protein [Lecanosticta acicola]|uniref:Uncharacterized protein n=1 Tax=Lecanosticta acicola TaxID=111012 RepID=A0AAI9ECT3_9PEZI|nr:Hypothetical predicted protein [Lecanosticta acicola]